MSDVALRGTPWPPNLGAGRTPNRGYELEARSLPQEVEIDVSREMGGRKPYPIWLVRGFSLMLAVLIVAALVAGYGAVTGSIPLGILGTAMFVLALATMSAILGRGEEEKFGSERKR